jgi:UDP-N-acetylglucosamine--N-acetylmuramyl-(pentapeptide) pyrophosphoryl-undecaprenol N-acetylglucosamine transferase
VAELALVGLPAILVPLAVATDDHQSVNGRALEAMGAARLLDPRTLTPKDLADALRSCFTDPDRLVAMGRAAAGLARPLAASDIATECRALARAGEPGPAHEEGLER